MKKKILREYRRIRALAAAGGAAQTAREEVKPVRPAYVRPRRDYGALKAVIAFPFRLVGGMIELVFTLISFVFSLIAFIVSLIFDHIAQIALAAGVVVVLLFFGNNFDVEQTIREITGYWDALASLFQGNGDGWR